MKGSWRWSFLGHAFIEKLAGGNFRRGGAVMKARPKRVPRLWCALQGLLPLEACLAAQEAELAWPRPLSSVETAVDRKQPAKKRLERGN